MEKIKIDYREKRLIELLKDNVIIENLIIGDIMIEYADDIKLCIERKTYNDLWSSIKDGRLREQRSRLIEFCDHEKHHVIYIIEGSEDDIKDHKEICRNAIHRLSLLYQFHVHKTKTIEETAEYLLWLKNQTTLFEKRTITENQITNLSKSIIKKKKDVQTPQQYLIAFLQSISGISYDKAKQIIFDEMDDINSFIEKCKSMGIETFSERKIHTKNKTQKIGLILSDRIYTLLGINKQKMI